MHLCRSVKLIVNRYFQVRKLVDICQVIRGSENSRIGLLKIDWEGSLGDTVAFNEMDHPNIFNVNLPASNFWNFPLIRYY